jgi:CDGSH-type Zn-finger protein
MTRQVRCEGTGPIKIEPSDTPTWVCGCGLSKKPPLCDGSHKKTKAEEPGKLYSYDADGEVVDVFDAKS